MGVGWGANHHGVYIGRSENGVDRADVAAIGRLDRFRRCGDRVGNCYQSGAGSAGNSARMDLTDATSAKNSETKCHNGSLDFVRTSQLTLRPHKPSRSWHR